MAETPTPATPSGDPSVVAVTPAKQAANLAALAAYARAAHARVPADVSGEGMRSEHASAFNALLASHREALLDLAAHCENGAAAARAFAAVEADNTEAVEGLNGEIPGLA